MLDRHDPDRDFAEKEQGIVHHGHEVYRRRLFRPKEAF